MRAGDLLHSLGVVVDVEAGALDSAQAVLAARTAFVRLYEEGLLRLTEQVIDTCPRCLTVVARADAEPVEIEEEELHLRLSTSGSGRVDVVTRAPELLPGAVALAVPRGDPAVGQVAELPIAGHTVPIIATDVTDGWLVVPAHDRRGCEAARRHRLTPVEVLDLDGVVRVPGPLNGLGRYAARTAAVELLVAEGVVAEQVTVSSSAARCRRCRTTLEPRLGRHWVLSMTPMELAAADAVREGVLGFSPTTARDDFLARAGQGRGWCVSYQLAAGQPVPAATCLDCGELVVAVEPPESCPRCMGELLPDLGVLDAHFVGAVWPLASAGWPSAQGPTAATTLILGPVRLIGWAVTMAAIGYRLTGKLPFSEIVLLETDDSSGEVDPLVAEHGGLLVRLALLRGGLDLDRAAEDLEGLRAAGIEAHDLADWDAAVASGRMGEALDMVLSGAASIPSALAVMLGDVAR
jgi:valyl-tRNA synthetase